jgi:hypothetical protein
MILYCTPESYEAVAARVRAAVAAAPPPKTTRNPLPGFLARSVVAIVASLPLFALPSLVRVDLFAPLLVLVFALAAVWFFPVFGWAVLGGLAWIAVGAAIVGSTPYRSTIDNATYPQAALMATEDWIGVGVALAGALCLVWLSVGLIRGRFPSALARDFEEQAR